MAAAVSPLAPKSFPELPEIEGVRFATGAAGIRYKDRTDVMLALFDKGTQVAGVFTKSKCPSAPVEWCRARLKGGKARALLVNSGNANAFTGKTRRRRRSNSPPRSPPRRPAAPVNEIFLASTGVIGEPLDASKFDGVLDRLAARAAPGRAARGRQGDHDDRHLSESRDRERDARRRRGHDFRHGERRGHDRAGHGDHAGLRVHRRADRRGGLAIHARQRACKAPSTRSPSTATPRPPTLCCCLRRAPPPSVARRKSPPPMTAAWRPSNRRSTRLLLDLAHQVVRDGEGARKFVEVQVTGAASAGAAKKIALSIANSPLVKTAIAGEDANWGRIVMAVGKAGERAERDKLAIWFGGVRVAHKGQRDPAYDEAEGLRNSCAPTRSPSASIWASARAPPRSGPAISPRTMSRSTATTGREKLT